MKLRLRLRDERAIALPLALAVMVACGALMVAVVEFSSSSGRIATVGQGRTSALALAEAGLNNAMAVLSEPTNNALDSTLLPERTTTYDEGSVTWWGTLDANTAYWTITAIGRVANGARVGGELTRTLTASVEVQPTLSQPLNTQAWNYIYSRQTGNTCDMTIAQTVTINSPLYVNGNLCLQNQASVAKGPLLVGGKITQTSNNTIGTTAVPLNSVNVGGSCSKGSTTQNPCIGGSAVNIFASTISNEVPAIPPPTVDWDGWYLAANPGPYYPCTTTSGLVPSFDNDQGTLENASATQRNNSMNASVIDLTPPSYSYTCRTAAGELSWNHLTKVLTVAGTIFVDGSAKVQHGTVATYEGFATIYLSGTLLIKNSHLCAVKSDDGTTCTASGWTSNSKMLVFVVGGSGAMGGAASQVGVSNGVELVSAYFQGAIYATSAIDIATTSQMDGPLDGATVKLGQSTQSSWPFFTIVPAGMPGNPVAYAEPQRPAYGG